MKLDVFMRDLRKEHGERQVDMAEKIGVSSSFLRAVLNGHKQFPYKWINLFQKAYGLTATQMDVLRNCIDELEGIEDVEWDESHVTNDMAFYECATKDYVVKVVQNLYSAYCSYTLGYYTPDGGHHVYQDYGTKSAGTLTNIEKRLSQTGTLLPRKRRES